MEQRLEALLVQAEKKGLPSLTPAEIPELGRLYRQAAAHLSRLRTRGAQTPELQNLNALVARAYTLIYTAQPTPPVRFGTLLLTDFPRTLRRQWKFLAVSLAAFLVGALLGAALTAVDPQMPDILMGPGWSGELQHLAERHAGVKNWMPDESRPMQSSFIITNNIRVSFLAFASGILLGLGPLYLMWFNGVMLGACGLVVADAHVATSFWAFVAPHGVLELTAIFISGAAGLMLAAAVVDPGEFTRSQALRLAAADTLPLMVGVTVMLLIAGTFEAFLDPVPEIPPAVKFTLATVLFVCMVSFFWIRGRPIEPSDAPSLAPS